MFQCTWSMKLFLKFAFCLILIAGKIAHCIDTTNVLDDQQKQTQTAFTTIGSRLSESAVLPCGISLNQYLINEVDGLLSIPVLVNWYRHFSLTRKSDRPIFAKYLAHLIDYDPHVEREYENRVEMVNHTSLNITALKASDEGFYECRLIFFDKAYSDNQNGSMVYLQIYVAPEFEKTSDEIYFLKTGMPIRLFCYAKGKPTPTISWFKNGKKLDVNTNVYYETSVEHRNEDLIEYTCRAENINGHIEHKIKVIKSGSLIFTEPLKNQTIQEGVLMNWPCLAQSNGEVLYKWFKNSIIVESALDKWDERGALFQDGMLYLSETLRSDSGFYECHAYTPTKRIQSSAYLNVIYPPEFVDFETKLYVLEGSQSMILDCLTNANPKVHKYEWYKDKRLLNTDPRNVSKYFVHANGSLQVFNFQKSDRGEYNCKAENTIKKVISPLVKVDIMENTRKIDYVTYGSAGQSMHKFDCKVANATVKWHKIGSRLPTQRHEAQGDGTLDLYGLKKTDSGLYLCIINTTVVQEKLIRLIIVNNSTMKTPETQLNRSNDKLADHLADTTLPLAPVNIRLNQTSDNDILIGWSYPLASKVKIESFQISYRYFKNDSMTGVVEYSDWLTTETLSPSETSYTFKSYDLIENEYYQFRMFTYSIYSQSLPSESVTIKYKPNDQLTDNVRAYKNIAILPKHATFLTSVSQLDIVLVSVFIVLLFLLSISIVGCIVYYRSYRLNKKDRSDSKNFDDWGFQASSGMTTAFLPSTNSSSDKSLSQPISSNTNHTSCSTIEKPLVSDDKSDGGLNDVLVVHNTTGNSAREMKTLRAVPMSNGKRSNLSTTSNSTTTTTANTNKNSGLQIKYQCMNKEYGEKQHQSLLASHYRHDDDYAHWPVNTASSYSPHIESSSVYSTSTDSSTVPTVRQQQYGNDVHNWSYRDSIRSTNHKSSEFSEYDYVDRTKRDSFNPAFPSVLNRAAYAQANVGKRTRFNDDQVIENESLLDNKRRSTTTANELNLIRNIQETYNALKMDYV